MSNQNTQPEYCAFLPFPYASFESAIWRCYMPAEGKTGWGGANNGAELWVPHRHLWMPETLHLILHALDAYLPAHDLADAKVTIRAPAYGARGRRPKGATGPRPVTCGDAVRIQICAAGWRFMNGDDAWRVRRAVQSYGETARHFAPRPCPSTWTRPSARIFRRT